MQWHLRRLVVIPVVWYTVIDDKDRVKQIWEAVYSDMEDAARKHIYTSSFSTFYYTKMKQSEKTVRKNDLLFCGAPHLFIAHEKYVGKWADDSKVNCNRCHHCCHTYDTFIGKDVLMNGYEYVIEMPKTEKGVSMFR